MKMETHCLLRWWRPRDIQNNKNHSDSHLLSTYNVADIRLSPLHIFLHFSFPKQCHKVGIPAIPTGAGPAEIDHLVRMLQRKVKVNGPSSCPLPSLTTLGSSDSMNMSLKWIVQASQLAGSHKASEQRAILRFTYWKVFKLHLSLSSGRLKSHKNLIICRQGDDVIEKMLHFNYFIYPFSNFP